jgi:hypothetical protein
VLGADDFANLALACYLKLVSLDSRGTIFLVDELYKDLLKFGLSRFLLASLPNLGSFDSLHFRSSRAGSQTGYLLHRSKTRMGKQSSHSRGNLVHTKIPWPACGLNDLEAYIMAYFKTTVESTITFF